MMRSLLLTFLVTYVSASDKLPEFQGVGMVAEDEKMAQANMMQMVADHEGDEERKNIFDYLGAMLDQFFKGLNSLSDDDMGLDSNTNTGFEKETDERFWKVYEDVCNQGKECTNSPYMGCNCHGHVDKLEENTCREYPCNLVKHGLENAAQLLRDIRDQKNLEGLVNVSMTFAEPLMKSACQCNPSLITTAISCVEDYNGDLIEDEDKEDYTEFMSIVKFDDMKMFASTMLKAYCGNDAGACLGAFQNVSTTLAAMMDRSCDGEQEDQCNNFRRLSNGIWKFIEFLSDEDREEELTLKTIVKKFYKHIPRNFWCGNAKCAAGYLSENFNNNCCFRNAVGKFDVKIVHHLERFVRSMFVAAGEKLPKFGKGVRKRISKTVNPNYACKNRYHRDAAECDALEYYLL